MKKFTAVITLTLVIALLAGIAASAESGYAYGESVLNEFAPGWTAIQADETVISLTPGACQGEIRFGWLSKDENSRFMISESSDMSASKEIEVETSGAIDGYISNKVTVSSLEEGKTYFYSYTENGVWSEPAPVSVQNDEDFTVLYVSDAQIGRSGDETLEEVLIRDTCGWNYTVNKMTGRYSDAAFVISGGDQFQSPDSITQMKAYLSPEALRSLPVANTIGNHDNGATLYGDIFNNPNEVKELFGDEAGTGYYYTYGDVLFITVNSNNNFLFDTAKVLKSAVKAYPDAKWRVVTMHHNPYSASLSDGEYSEERLLFSALYDCYDIDLVLSGHDHLYSRTEPMYAGKKAEGEGTVYVQSSSASGSNYDPLPDELASFTVSAFDVRVPTYTALTFTDGAITGTTYRTDTDEIIDSFEVKDNTSDSRADIFSVMISMIKTLFSMI
ncbi:MAG: metallophosphoesterase family protein [Ruminococcaceae bacterium]|nr:metallophosphoesterase family protein [Oscillospiraceae bacterium]